jgi:cytochrome oxidase assembly protein ShyY1
MYRFLLTPRWLLFHLVVIAAIVAMVFAAFWQLDRLDQRRTFNDAVRERSQQQPVDLAVILDDLDAGRLEPSTAEWLPVTVSGTYLPGQVVEFNNSQGGRAGDNVLTALSFGGGGTVIVNRGFIPLALEDDLPAAPSGDVTVTGFVRPSEVRDRGGVTDADDDEPLTEIRRIDIPRLSQQFPGDVAPVYVQLTGSDPPLTAGDPAPVVLPELDEGPHLSYAIQWFIFAICVAVGWVLAVRRSLAIRAAGQRPGDGGSRRRDDVEGPSRPARTSRPSS